MSDRLHVAVVGAGIRGRMYGSVVQEHPDSTLVGFCENSEPVATVVADQYGVPVRPSLAELLDGLDEVDAVIIATPDFAHREAGEEALRAGLHTMFEKPLATTLTDAKALQQAATGAGHVMLGFENRWNPSFQTVRHTLEQSQQTFVAQRANLQDTHWVPREMLPWSGQSTPAWFLMPHSLDMAMWLSDAEPVEVFARGVRKVLTADGISTWDRITASFLMSDDSLVSLDSGWTLPTGRPAVFDFRFEVETAREHYLVEIDRSGVTRVNDAGVSYVANAERDGRGRLRGAPVDMTRDFIDLCRGAEVEYPSLEHGLKITTALDALHESLNSGRNIRIGH